jgi:ATPase family associated with various cellular activities (AAA)
VNGPVLHKRSGTESEERLDHGVGERLRVLSSHVRQLVASRRANDPEADDLYRGLYVSDDEAKALASESGERTVDSRWAPFLPLPMPLVGTRLGDMAAAFDLTEFDLDLLLVAIATDLEPRFEKLFGYLHDDVTRRRPSVGLALELTGHGFADAGARSRLGWDAPLVRYGLVCVEEPTRGFLTRPLRVPDRVTAHLLGDDHIEPSVDRCRIASVIIESPEANQVAAAIKAGISTVYLQDSGAGVGAAVGATALTLVGRGSICIDLNDDEDDPLVVVHSAIREARFAMAGLVVTLADSVTEQRPEVMRTLAESRWPVIVVGSHPWDASWSRNPVVSEVVPRPSGSTIAAVWESCLPELEAKALEGVTRQLRMRPDQIVRAGELAHRRALGAGRPVNTEDVGIAARAQNSSKLERLARRIHPTVQWSDLVLSPEIVALLREIETRYRCRDLVHGDWGMGGKNNRRLGVVSLFAGPSGVGKTMAAEALAGSLGLDMYQVNLATVVDKYIGETEKNLERIFEAAEGVNGVILFDEADALFGKRSEVSDARDRYANVEVAYLLQRLETYEGVAVLATNLRTNIDDAFTRRLDVVVDFPEPDEGDRRILWDRCIGPLAPRDEDVDLDFLAARFRLAGGNIRNITVAAAFLAAAEDRTLSMGDLVRATAQEYRKLGRLFTASEFGHWHNQVTS